MEIRKKKNFLDHIWIHISGDPMIKKAPESVDLLGLAFPSNLRMLIQPM